MASLVEYLKGVNSTFSVPQDDLKTVEVTDVMDGLEADLYTKLKDFERLLEDTYAFYRIMGLLALLLYNIQM